VTRRNDATTSPIRAAVELANDAKNSPRRANVAVMMTPTRCPTADSRSNAGASVCETVVPMRDSVD
jgi:hypothetical protein